MIKNILQWAMTNGKIALVIELGFTRIKAVLFGGDDPLAQEIQIFFRDVCADDPAPESGDHGFIRDSHLAGDCHFLLFYKYLATAIASIATTSRTKSNWYAFINDDCKRFISWTLAGFGALCADSISAPSFSILPCVGPK